MQIDMRNRLAELLKDTLHEWKCDVLPETVLQIADHLIENDVVPVVRCKDCLYAREIYGKLECIHGVIYRNSYNRPDDYCSYGEQKL